MMHYTIFFYVYPQHTQNKISKSCNQVYNYKMHNVPWKCVINKFVMNWTNWTGNFRDKFTAVNRVNRKTDIKKFQIISTCGKKTSRFLIYIAA